MGSEMCIRDSTMHSKQNSPSRNRQVSPLSSHIAGIFPGAVMRTPLTVTTQALQTALSLSSDSTISLGGVAAP